MKTWAVASSMLCLGLGAGFASGWYYPRSRAATSGELFSRRARCHEIAAQYEKAKSNDTDGVIVESVGYAPVSNTCVANVTDMQRLSSTYTSETWSVVDLLSSEVLYSGWCREEKNCGDGRNFELMGKSEAAFKQALAGRKVDVSKVAVLPSKPKAIEPISKAQSDAFLKDLAAVATPIAKPKPVDHGWEFADEPTKGRKK